MDDVIKFFKNLIRYRIRINNYILQNNIILCSSLLKLIFYSFHFLLKKRYEHLINEIKSQLFVPYKKIILLRKLALLSNVSKDSQEDNRKLEIFKGLIKIIQIKLKVD